MALIIDDGEGFFLEISFDRNDGVDLIISSPGELMETSLTDKETLTLYAFLKNHLEPDLKNV